jgi:hypothetical protein
MSSLSLAKDSNLPGCGWMTGYPDITRQAGGNVRLAD